MGSRHCRLYKLFLPALPIVCVHYNIVSFIRIMCLLNCVIGANFRHRHSGKVKLSDSIVKTRYGRVQGELIEFGGHPSLGSVEVFRGLKYASLLGGSLRLMPPTGPTDRWDGVYKTIQFGPSCPQIVPPKEDINRRYTHVISRRMLKKLEFVQTQAEECLNLNIYRPVTTNRSTAGLPIVVIVHGDGFDQGTGNAYDASVLSSFGNVIAITLNYRLGLLGFFSSHDSNAPGNYALLDIIAALHWLKENILDFGGDLNKITLMGHGNGAVLVNLLAVSPMSKENTLFRGVILQSGSSFSPWARIANPAMCTRRLIACLQCGNDPQHNTSLLVTCIKGKSVNILLNCTTRPLKYLSCLGPVVNRWSGVLPRSLTRLHTEKKSSFFAIPLLLGLAQHEALIWLTKDDIENGISESRKKHLLRTFVNNVPSFRSNRIYGFLDYYYTNWENVSDKYTRVVSILEYLTDSMYVAPILNLAKYHAAGAAATYLYSLGDTWSYNGADKTFKDDIYGNELAYALGAPLVVHLSPFRSTFSQTDCFISEQVMTYWTHFIQESNPNGPKQESSSQYRQSRKANVVEWPEYSTKQQMILLIGEKSRVKFHYKDNKMALWTDFISKLHTDYQTHKQDTFETSKYYYNPFSSFNITHPLDRLHYPVSLTTRAYTSVTRSPGMFLVNPQSNATIIPSLSRSTYPPNSKQDHLNLLTENRKQNVPAVPVDRNMSTMPSRISFSITIAIGCSLLFINLLVFVGIYYQRQKISKENGSEYEEDDSAECDHSRPNMFGIVREPTEHCGNSFASKFNQLKL